MTNSMFERLQSLPLLMGLGTGELINIVEKVKIEFHKFYDSNTIVCQDDRCDKVVYVLQGELCASRRDDRMHLTTYEFFTKNPYVIEPQNIFGMSQRYEYTYSLTGAGSICSIEKSQLSSLMSQYEVVKTNFLSLICNQLQTATARLRESLPQTAEDKLLRFLENNKVCRQGSTQVRINMVDLAGLLAEPRLKVSNILNQWKDAGLVQLNRGGFTIHDDKRLFMKSHKDIYKNNPKQQ